MARSSRPEASPDSSQGVTKRPRVPEALREVDELASRDDIDGLVQLFEATDELDPDRQERTHRRFYTAFQSMDRSDLARRALTRAAGPHNHLASSVWGRDEPTGFAASRRQFAEALDLICPGPERDVWMNCFDRLADGATTVADTSVETPRFDAATGHRWRMLAVAGMGWSGSGAVYDALRGYQRAAPVHGENRLIEGRYGLLRLGERSRTHPQRAFVDFFRYCLFGFAPCHDWEDYRHVRNARRASTGRSPEQYAVACRAALTSIMSAAVDDLDEVSTRWRMPLLESASLSQLGTTDVVPILDNVVHIENLSIAPSLPHVLFFAVVRDPRDQFIDLLNSNPRFHGDPQRFIKKYRSTRRKLESASTSEAVRFVRFEDFVRNETTRERVLADVVDVLGPPGDRQRFDPAISSKNVGLWRAVPDDPAIELISRELDSFLVD